MDTKQVLDLIRECKVYVMTTVDTKGMPQARLMSSLVIDDSFLFHISTFAGARKVQQVAANPNCQLLFFRQDMQQWVTLSGTASIEKDPARKRDLFLRFAKIQDYFKSPEDPNYGVVRFQAKRVEFSSFESMKPDILDL